MTSSKKSKEEEEARSGLENSGRGVKGQKSRSGVSTNGFEGGQMPLYRRLPKRGFKNPFRTKIQNINFSTINNMIKKYNLNPEKLLKKNYLIKKFLRDLKEVSNFLSRKLENITNLEISYASKKAVETIEKLGGKIKLTKK